MKKYLSLLTLLLISYLNVFSQTAVDFDVADCSGKNYKLFSLLDEGSVVVIVWVMPCGTCIAPAKSASNIVSKMSNAKVQMFLCDDYANTNCSILENWRSANNITANALFSNNKIKMTDYGSNGMPKVVVLGGKEHKVLYNKNGSVNETDFQNAINSGLNMNGIEPPSKQEIDVNIFPNPFHTSFRIETNLFSTEKITVSIYNSTGQKVLSSTQANNGVSIPINLSHLPTGLYHLLLSDNKQFATKTLFRY